MYSSSRHDIRDVYVLQVADDEVDDPDLSLRLGEGLRESTGGEIRTVTSQADAGIYRLVLQCIYSESCSVGVAGCLAAQQVSSPERHSRGYGL